MSAVDKEIESNTHPDLSHATDVVEHEQNTYEGLKEEKEPLFVEDRTHNFKLNHAIQYKVIIYNFNKTIMKWKIILIHPI